MAKLSQIEKNLAPQAAAFPIYLEFIFYFIEIQNYAMIKWGRQGESCTLSGCSDHLQPALEYEYFLKI